VVADLFFLQSKRRHTSLVSDWSSDVCSSDLRANNRRSTGRVGVLLVLDDQCCGGYFRVHESEFRPDCGVRKAGRPESVANVVLPGRAPLAKAGSKSFTTSGPDPLGAPMAILFPPGGPLVTYNTSFRNRTTFGPAKPPKLVSSTGSVTKKCPAPGITTVRAKKPARFSAARNAVDCVAGSTMSS